MQNRNTNKLPISVRTQSLPGLNVSAGPYIATVKNVIDPTFMGRLEVLIDSMDSGTSDDPSSWRMVSYLSPFYGTTPTPSTKNIDFNDTQKSYGMWMVPPDVGTKVLVIFVEGNPRLGFWIGCIPDTLINHMVPGLAGDKDNVVAAEINKTARSTDTAAEVRPLHPFAARLAVQGLDKDPIRGTTTSSSRRESPSAVFGISTPGPLDDGNSDIRKQYPGVNLTAPKDLGGDAQATHNILTSRLGGHTLVMDDGDENHQNELVRLRTRTGHQILMHDTFGLIYIANADGTAWMEFTNSGRIDVYTKNSITWHSDADINFHASKNINLEAGSSVNIKSGSSFAVSTGTYQIFGSGSGSLKGASLTLESGGTIGIKAAGAMGLNGATIDLNGAAPALVSASSLSTLVDRVPTKEPWKKHDVQNLVTATVDLSASSLGGTSVRVLPPIPVTVVEETTAPTPTTSEAVALDQTSSSQIESDSLRSASQGENSDQMMASLKAKMAANQDDSLTNDEKFDMSFESAFGETYGETDMASFKSGLNDTNSFGTTDMGGWTALKDKFQNLYQSDSAAASIPTDDYATPESRQQDIATRDSLLAQDANLRGEAAYDSSEAVARREKIAAINQRLQGRNNV